MRVHVYNASRLDVARLTLDAFGMPTPRGPPWLTSSDQHTLGGMMLSRLLRDTRCPLVPPHEADLFVVPLSQEPVAAATADEAGKVHDFMPPSERDGIVRTCERIRDEDWFVTLRPHLTWRTARRHLFLHPRFLAIFGFCRGAVRDFRSRALANPSLEQWVWLDNAVYPSGGMRTFSMAYPSSVHLRRADLLSAPHAGGRAAAPRHMDDTWRLRPGLPPWAPGALPNVPRRHLMMFGGSMHGSALARQLRPHAAARRTERAALWWPGRAARAAVWWPARAACAVV